MTGQNVMEHSDQASATRRLPGPGALSAPEGPSKESWYPASAMTRAEIAVEVNTAGGHRLVAKVVRHPSSRAWVWMERRRDAVTGWAVLAPYVMPDRFARTSPGRSSPLSWRPIPGTAWPFPLPEPISSPVLRPPAPAAIPEIAEPAEIAGEDWPYPGIVLGLRTPPESLAECQARVMRGLRTMHAAGTVELDRPGGGLDSALIVYRNAIRGRRERDPEAYVDRAHIPDVHVAWTPTRRDLGDWDYALAWFLVLDDRRRKVVSMRAANPVWSWRGIGDQLRLTHSRVRQIFDAAGKAMFEVGRQA